MRHLFIALLPLVAIFATLPPNPAWAQKPTTIRSGGWTVTSTTQTGFARHRDGRRRVLWSKAEPYNACAVFRSGRLLSMVGSVVSFELDEGHDCESAAHPGARHTFAAFELNSGQAVSLYDYFDRAVVDDAVAANAYLKKTAHDDYATSCVYSLSEFDKSFAFSDVRGGKVEVRVGLIHGCEVERGTVTEINLKLSATKRLQRQVRSAGRARLLLKALRARAPLDTEWLPALPAKP